RLAQCCCQAHHWFALQRFSLFPPHQHRRHSMTTQPHARKTVQCAIYTRKSNEEGLQQEFNSLDAQREACQAYITSQQHEGWICFPEHYDDGGFSGGNM